MIKEQLLEYCFTYVEERIVSAQKFRSETTSSISFDFHFVFWHSILGKYNHDLQ